jgi:membrane associated rhomboid family serine protease
MGFSSRSYTRSYVFGGGIPPGVKLLLLSNVLIFLLMLFAEPLIVSLFGLRPVDVVARFRVWQVATYLFLHGGVFHILFNMLALWFFGSELERLWGTRKFLRFYFICGVGAGICVVLANYMFGNPASVTIGASGAIYGILLVAAVMFPDRIIIFYIFPIKLKYFVMILAAISLYGLRDSNSGVSDIAHLSGMVFGYLFYKTPRVRGFDPLASLREQYRAWKLARAKKKFQVYLRKQGSNRDPWVH